MNLQILNRYHGLLKKSSFHGGIEMVDGRLGPVSNQMQDFADNTVHIWQVPLDPQSDGLPFLSSILSMDERRRSERFHFQQHRRRYIVGRAFLRIFIGHYLNIEPESVVFTYSNRGKPLLADTIDHEGLRFNLSHSHELALYAFMWDCLVGIDVERMRSEMDADKLAQRYFSHRESTFVTSCSGTKAQEAFFRMWTIKEAYLKATGEGLSGLERVEVLADFDWRSVNLIVDGENQDSNWSVYPFSPQPGYMAALVAQ